ncbi:MAG: hypothetical protein R3B40_15650 [Polyangiales bacterium]|nr:hypothetical protein [Sandaracinaceae bacterium]
MAFPLEQPERERALEDAPPDLFREIAKQLAGDVPAADGMAQVGGEPSDREELGAIATDSDGGLGLEGPDTDAALKIDHASTSQPMSPW